MIIDQDDNGDRASETHIEEAFTSGNWDRPLTRKYPNAIDKMCADYCASVPLNARHMLNQHLFLTESRLLGLGPRGLGISDILCALHGCGVPVILRPASNKGFLAVRECYLHGIMDGEAFGERQEYSERTLDIM